MVVYDEGRTKPEWQEGGDASIYYHKFEKARVLRKVEQSMTHRKVETHPYKDNKLNGSLSGAWYVYMKLELKIEGYKGSKQGREEHDLQDGRDAPIEQS